MNPDQTIRHDVTLITEDDLYLFNEGNHYRLFRKLGAHPMEVDGVAGTYFSVWAPDAHHVFVTGDFNGWHRESHELWARGVSGIWEGFVPGVTQGAIYKYYIHSRYNEYRVEKADPFAFYGEVPPRTGSIVWDLGYTWRDDPWMAGRHARNSGKAPTAIYEVHLGSWMRTPEGTSAPVLPGDGPAAGRVCEEARLHPRGIPPGHGASLLRLLGL